MEPGAAPSSEGDRSVSRQAARGLCANCVHRADCTLDRPEGPVLFCEDYKGESRQPAESPVQAQPVPEVVEASPVIGLCSSCANLPTCTSPRPPSGVWHCERYA